MDAINDDLYMYLDKLVKTIETQADFKFGGIYVISQNRVDDILCCIDINFPKILKTFKKEQDEDKNVSSLHLYDKLIANIKIKLPFVKANYFVNYGEVSNIVRLLKQSFPADVAYINKSYPNLNKD